MLILRADGRTIDGLDFSVRTFTRATAPSNTSVNSQTAGFLIPVTLLITILALVDGYTEQGQNSELSYPLG